MIKKTAFRITLATALAISPIVNLLGQSNQMIGHEHPYVFHLVQADLWHATLAEQGSIYYPPTYDVDGFTHGTANPEKLLVVANHFTQRSGETGCATYDRRKSARVWR